MQPSFLDLAKAIMAAPPAEAAKPACCWPPNACPAAQAVPVSGLVQMASGGLVIATGKLPT